MAEMDAHFELLEWSQGDKFHKAAKAPKGDFSVSDLWGLRALVVKFVFVFAFWRQIPWVWLP